MRRYNPKEIEPKWQAKWEESGIYNVDFNSKKPKYVGFGMFNYPSGAGIHVGHVRNFTIPDVITRTKRQQGFESYQPVGWDSFGMPAENYAIKTGVAPQVSIKQAIEKYHTQYRAMGWAMDWSKEIDTTEPEYYKWTQWCFAKLFENGLAYQKESPQWWCDQCKTVLADEQVIAGQCWRHDNPDDPFVTKRSLRQWFFKITDYADELLEATDDLNWTQSVKSSQKSWIGRSVGAEIDFKIENSEDVIKVFTTRPDTLFGATFMVLAPEHPLADSLTVESQKEEITAYKDAAIRKSEVQRQQDADKEKTGVFTGSYAINPVNGEKIPIWIADYILMGYGTGAIMAVPAHDERDYDFAKKFDIPVHEVVAPDFGVPLPDPVDVTGPVIIGYDPNTKKFMSLINTKNDMRWLASGGLDEGESYENAALRELAEEAGFKNVKKLIKLGGPTYSYYFNSNKNSNRRSFSYMYLAIIDAKEQTDQALEAHEQYEVTWSDAKAILDDFNREPDGRGHWIDGMQRAQEAVEAYEAGEEYVGPIISTEGVLFNSAQTDYPLVTNVQLPEDAEVSDRGEAIVAIVYDPVAKKYLTVNWRADSSDPTGNWAGNLFIGGGIEEGEDHISAACREVAEETGYTNLKFVRKMQHSIVHHYYSVPRGAWRRARITGLLFELAGPERIEQKLEDYEKDKFDVEWVSEISIEDTLKHDEAHKMVYQFLIQDDTLAVSRSSYNGLSSSEAREKIVADLAEQGVATEKVNYKMRDWLISRQRYWGAPIPIIHCEKDGPVLVPEADLPVVLPVIEDYRPTGGKASVLAGVEEWVNTSCPKCGGPGKRETDTMDGYVCSSWYFLRYMDPTNNKQAWDPKIAGKWMPIDCYNGGDHATAHLLYARFFNRFFHKLGLVESQEPFKKMIFNGKIKAGDGSAFSKSKGNGIDPLEVIEQGYGADAIRLYEMFAAPVELDVLWDIQGIPGAYRFLSRVWNITQEYIGSSSEVPKADNEDILKITHKMIKKVTEDIEEDRFNTAIASLMELTNYLYKAKESTGIFQSGNWRFAIESLLMLVAPFAPHIAEELWSELGNKDTIHVDHWPMWEDKYLQSDTMKIVVQINGKVRSTVEVDSDATKEQVIEITMKDKKVAEYLNGNSVKKTIYVPNRLVNFVI